MKTLYSRTISGLLITLCGIVSCASQDQFEQAASEAASQLASVEKAINAKIKTENRYYYDDALKRTTEDLKKWRADSRTYMLLKNGDAFIAKNTGKNAKILGGELKRHIERTIAEWREQESARDRLQAEITTTLEASRKKMEYESKKISALRSKLRALGESSDNKALLRFIVAYVGEVDNALEVIEQDAAKAADAAEGRPIIEQEG